MSPSYTKTNATTIGVTIGVRHMCDYLLSMNYPVIANFRLKITKGLSHRDVCALARSMSQD